MSKVRQAHSDLHQVDWKRSLAVAAFLCGFVLVAAFPAFPQSWQVPETISGILLESQQQAQLATDSQATGQISGTVVDRSGVPVVGAGVVLTRDDSSAKQETVTGEDGKFAFARVEPGSFHLTVTAQNFAPQSLNGTVVAGQNDIIPQIVLAIATAFTEIRVTPSIEEIAQEQLKEEEKQRVLGFIPNFYVTYIPDAAPLSPKQKFQLAFRSLIDPVNFGLTGALAGVQQGRDDFHGYGQGAAGYARRFGAAYGDGVTGTMIGGAILPSLLKQDPRYFYKGTGSKRSRLLYALATSVICKGDNGHWQPNYSSIVGSMAAGGISNLYYPPEDRNGFGLTMENALLSIAGSAATNIVQEFIIKKITPNLPNHDTNKQPNALSKLLGSFVREGDGG